MGPLQSDRGLWIDAGVHGTWEAIARDVLDETGLNRGPQDAFRLATACGLVLVPGGGSDGSLSGDLLTYPVQARRVRQHQVIAHELGHWSLERAGEDAHDEDAADWVGDALMLPRAPFENDLRASAWDFHVLRTKHLNCSSSSIARRIVQVRDAVATVIDQGRVTMRVASPWLGDPRLKRISAWERLLVEEALAENLTVHGDELCYAVPIFDGPHRRVVLVCEAEQLSLRL